MKKMVFTLALLLMSLSAALAQTWNFADRDPFITESDVALINADATNWYNDAAKGRYNFLAALDNAALTANGTELDFVKGLLFKCGVAVASSNGTPANQSGKIRLNYNGEYLELNGSNLVVTIPNVQKDWVVTVVCKTASSKTARGLYVSSNVGGTTNFGTKTTSQITCTGTVSEAGDVTLTTSDGGMWIYSISVKDPNSIVPDPVDPDNSNKVNNAVSRDTYKNQMFVTTNSGAVNYYNTEDLSKVTFEGDKTIVVPVKSGAENDEFNATVKELSFAKAAERGESGEVTENGITITESKGWQESAYAKWNLLSDAKSYNVYVKGGQYADYTKVDQQLVRNYGSYGRVDVVGLKAGNYSLKVVAVGADGAEMSAHGIADNLKVVNYDRQGFAHKGISDGVGAYNNDGTLKAGAKVLYITKNTFKTIKASLSDGKNDVEYTGIGNILLAKQKGKDNTPIAVRIIGEIKTADAGDQLKTDQKGLLLKGNSISTEMNVTIEGIGDDACFNGFGLGLVNGTGVEVRNMAFFYQGSSNDNMEIKGTNHIWVHNNDYFYGEKGSGDHGKGDGSLDSKDGASFCTFSYNHFHDTGKSNLCGMKSETVDNLICYHHNWFDHSDSRHPRVRTSSVHVWNNYYDGVAKYGVGVTMGASVFVESNYFRNTKYPMMISLQGTDAKGDGTFSGENGGVVKAYGNIFAEKGSYFSYITWKQSNTDFDAYEVDSPSEKVPSTVVAKKGSTSYNNFDTDASKMYTYTPDATVDVPAKVTGFYGAGRLNQGDIHYTFNNATDDADYGRCAGLDAILTSYKTNLVGIFGDENASSGETGGSGSGEGSGEGEGGSTGGSTGGTEGGSTVTPIEGTVTCSFTANGKEAVPSNSAFVLTGSAKNVKAEETVIEGTTYSASLKMESNTEVSFTTSQKMTLYVYYGLSGANNVKVDGVKQTGAPTTVVLEAGAHKITKGGTTTIALIKLVPVTE
uniref:pectate lyase family protein n=1 Tax=Prevotella sp. TaxID=59823 RepID=UPI00257B2D88